MVHWYPKYVPVGVRRARAAVEMHELRASGVKVQPVEVQDRKNLARSFWGRRWCDHLESFSDYANRLPRGRTYVRNGSVCHLAVEPGEVEAMVAGRELYRVVVRVKRLERPTWRTIKEACAGQIGSVIELLQGRLSDRVMDVVADRDTGLFPQPGEIELACDCPDRATMCKHAAAVLYGVGSRLDDSPELLFRLRGVDEAELIAADMVLPRAATTADTLAEGDLGDIFGIDLDPAGPAPAPNARKPEPGADPDGAARVRMPAADSDPEDARSGPAPSARSSAPGPKGSRKAKEALTPRSPRAGSRAAPPGPEDAGATASRFRPTSALIAGLRERGGFSVAEFADLLRVSAATVRRWEGAPGPLGLHARSREALAVLRLEIEK